MPLVTTRDLTKTYRMGKVDVHALRGVDMDVERGEFLGLLGASGSGKSTLLNLVGGLDKPTSGAVVVDGRDLGTLKRKQLAVYRRETLGFIFQQFHLIPTLTAQRNVELSMNFGGYSASERRRRAREALDFVGLGDRRGHKSTELSGGEQQRVAVARALARDPEILLADEPTGNLDTTTADSVMDIVDQRHRDGLTVIMVTHDRNLAEKHCTRIIEMRDGRIVGSDAPTLESAS